MLGGVEAGFPILCEILSYRCCEFRSFEDLNVGRAIPWTLESN